MAYDHDTWKQRRDIVWSTATANWLSLVKIVLLALILWRVW